MEGRRTVLYVSALGMFALGLMSKPMVITLPFVLVLCDIWPLEGRTARKESVPTTNRREGPFFNSLYLVAIVTVASQRAVSALNPSRLYARSSRQERGRSLLQVRRSASTRLVRSLVSYEKDISFAELSRGGIFLIAITASGVWQFSKKIPARRMVWFVGTLVSRDRPRPGRRTIDGRPVYYIPYFGLFIMVVFGAADC